MLMKNRHQNKHSLLTSILKCLALSLMCWAGSASALPIVVGGNWQLIDGNDALGLNGSSFDYRLNPGDVARVFNFPSGAQQTIYDLGERQLTLSGTLADGSYTAGSPRQNTSYLDAASLDRLDLGGHAFDIADYRVEIPSIRFSFAADFVNSTAAHALPEFGALDSAFFGLGSVQGRFGLQLWSSGLSSHRLARYTLSGATAHTINAVPEPGSLALCLLGLVGLAAGWRAKKSPD